MTPSYTAPELFGVHPSETTFASNIFSFGILAYEVFYGCPAWTKVNMSLIKNVKAGHRPIIPGTK